MSARAEKKAAWFRKRMADEWSVTPEQAQAEIDRRRAARAIATAQNTQNPSSVRPKPPVHVPDRLKLDPTPSPQRAQPLTSAVPLVDDAGEPLSAEEERLMLESNYGRELPRPKPTPVPIAYWPTPERPRKLTKQEKIDRFNAGLPFGEFEDED